MRAWIGALVVGLSFGCSGGGAKNDGGAGSGGGAAGGRGGGRRRRGSGRRRRGSGRRRRGSGRRRRGPGRRARARPAAPAGRREPVAAAAAQVAAPDPAAARVAAPAAVAARPAAAAWPAAASSSMADSAAAGCSPGCRSTRLMSVSVASPRQTAARQAATGASASPTRRRSPGIIRTTSSRVVHLQRQHDHGADADPRHPHRNPGAHLALHLGRRHLLLQRLPAVTGLLLPRHG